jgi:hypothetical protein
MTLGELPLWQLAAVVAVPREERIQCQCKGCGHTIWRQIHVIQWTDGRIECWGQECYKRELGPTAVGGASRAIYDSVGGRELTLEERELLTNNREHLIARLREEQEKTLQAEREREQERQRREREQEQQRRGWEQEREQQRQRARELAIEREAEERKRPHSIFSIPPRRLPRDGGFSSLLPAINVASDRLERLPSEPEGTCVFCGKKTNEWQSFSGKTGKCICSDCHRQGKTADLEQEEYRRILG